MKIFAFALIACLAIISPMITIWALNLLFSTQIPLNLATWFAVLWLSLIVGASRVKN